MQTDAFQNTCLHPSAYIRNAEPIFRDKNPFKNSVMFRAPWDESLTLTTS